jgi:hypothetical protein
MSWILLLLQWAEWFEQAVYGLSFKSVKWLPERARR